MQSDSTKEAQTEIEFEKYRKRGAYHWDNYFGKFSNIDCFLRGRYDLVISLLKKRSIGKESNVLEIGCGDGALLGLIYKNFRCNLWGSDPSDEGIRYSKEMFSKLGYKAQFARVGGYSLPFPNNHFDFIVLADVIEHLQHPEQMLIEMKRILKTGGTAIVTTPIRSMEVPEDKMHVREFFPIELTNICSQHFSHTDSVYSHPVVWYELYSYGLKRNRSLVRFYCRVMDKVFNNNVFLSTHLNKKWKNFKQQALVLTK